MKSHDAQIVNHAGARRGRRGLACLFWAIGGFVCALVAGLIVLVSVYAGWNTGLATARADAATTAQAYARQQCDRVPADLAAGNLRLAQSRLEDLASLPQTPTCLPLLAPNATAAHLLLMASPMPSATITASAPPPTATPLQPTAGPRIAATTAPPSEAQPVDYDLDALLLEAQEAMSLGDYPAAIDTLDAIISIDGDFQRELTRRLILQALTTQALSLYRGGRLSEAIVMTDRAEEYGNIEDLYHERFIALLYLDGQRYKATNPAEAVRQFSSMYFEYGVRDYVNGPIAADLQEAQRNYAMALAYQGDHCPAQAQFQAALDLNPPYSRVNLADLTARRDQSILACQAQQRATGVAPPGSNPSNATRAPVGHAG